MNTKDVKDIKIVGADTQMVMANNEIWWEKGVVPGPTVLIGGNLQAGFYGEVPTRDFITGDELAAKIGLTSGISQFSDEPWLKFSYMGKVEFVAKKPFRHSVSWNDINAVNAVFGNRTIDIGGKTYKIRLMKGKTEGKQNDSSACEGTINHRSEWNRLMLPIHINAPDKWKSLNNVKIPTENWNVGYTNNDLSSGSIRCWCQECGEKTVYRLFRFNYDISDAGSLNPGASSSYNGWRPVLELVD